MDPEIIEQKSAKTKLVLSNIYNLPGRSESILEITKLLNDPKTNNTVISNLISKDPAIATKILSIANSPLYGLRRSVTTIDFAILVLGFEGIKKIVLALSLIESFKNKTDKYLNQKDFWQHSILTGTAAKRISDDLGFKFGNEAFVIGLLHDLGIPVIHKYFHSDFVELFTQIHNGEEDIRGLEKNIFGMDHQEIGQFLSEKWDLPALFFDTIRYHHEPSEANIDKRLAYVVHLADYATHKLNVGNYYWDNNYKLDEGLLEELKFDSIENVDEFIAGYKSLFEGESIITL